MLVKELFSENESIDIKSYLNKHNIYDIDEFLKPTNKYIENPFDYKNIQKGIDLIKKYIDKDFIYLLTDADFDGVASSSIIYMYLKRLNNNLDIKVLTHNKKLHGLDDADILNELLNNNPSLLIIPDASGTKEQCKQLVDNGYEILSLNHHEVEEHEYICEINNQLSPNIENKQGSGTLVTHSFTRALDITFKVKYAKDYVDLVMLGSVADVMRMDNYYNRTYNYYGNMFFNNQFFKEIANKYTKDLSPHSISFGIVPKINSVIRSDDFELKQNIFKATVGEIDCNEIVEKCNKCHNKQKTTVKNVSEILEPLVNINDKVIILQYDEMPNSYTGLIAGKISGDFNKPCVIVKEKDNEFIGSTRSPIDIKDIFNQCKYVNWANGHQQSHGISINNLDKFREYCNRLELTTDVVKDVTASFSVNSIPSYLFEEFEKYKDIYGQGIQIPTIHINPFRINGRDLQSLGNGTTLKLKQQDYDIMFFFMSKEKCEQLYVGKNKNYKIEIIGELGINEFRGKRTKQIIVQDYEVSDDELSIDDIF